MKLKNVPMQKKNRLFAAHDKNKKEKKPSELLFYRQIWNMNLPLLEEK
jgi:hypothetical protein